MGREYRSHPRRVEDGLPAPPEPRTRARGRYKQACPVLRRLAFRPRALDAERDLYRTFAPAALPDALERRRGDGGAGARGWFRDARTRRELHIARRDRRGECGPQD